LLNFDTPSQFNIPSKGITVLGVPLNILPLKSSFIKDAMVKDVWHINLFPIVGDVKVVFGINILSFLKP
jgi:hypothetical protein